MMNTSQVSMISPMQLAASRRHFVKVFAPPSERRCHLRCLAICQRTRRLLADVIAAVSMASGNGIPVS